MTPSTISAQKWRSQSALLAHLSVSSRMACRLWGAALISCAAVAGMAMQCQKQAQLDLQALLARRQELEQFLNQTTAYPPAAAQDFSSELPFFGRDLVVIEALQHSARKSGIAVTSVSLREPPITRTDPLVRLELTVAAQGSYSALKQFVAEWLDRFPSATVRAQQWRRIDASGPPGAGPAAIEANWVLSVWTRPVGIEVGTHPLSEVPPLAAPPRPSTAAY